LIIFITITNVNSMGRFYVLFWSLKLVGKCITKAKIVEQKLHKHNTHNSNNLIMVLIRPQTRHLLTIVQIINVTVSLNLIFKGCAPNLRSKRKPTTVTKDE
ncbi:hypothetical protein BLOT_012567, partial [Blomia tropicalis]